VADIPTAFVATWGSGKPVIGIVGEFDDSALMTAFGQAGVGVFPVPTVVEAEIVAAYGVSLLGRSAEARTEYFAISAERRVTHPCVLAIAESARARFV